MCANWFALVFIRVGKCTGEWVIDQFGGAVFCRRE